MGLKQWANVAVCLIVLSILAYGVKRIADAPDVPSLINPDPGVSSVVVSLGDQVKLENFRFELDQVKNRVKAVFKLSNNSKATVFDVVVSCDLRDRSGELRGRDIWIIYDSIESGHSGRFIIDDKRYVSHLVTPDSIRCKIKDLKTAGFVVAAGDGGGH